MMMLKHFSVKLSLMEKLLQKHEQLLKRKAEEKVSKRAYFVFQDKIDKRS